MRAKKKGLARRERQILDVLYRMGQGTVAEVLANLPDRRTYSTVRAQLNVLEEKGHVRHQEQGLRYVYLPAVPRERAMRSAIRHLMETFFEGSAASMVTALLSSEGGRLTPEELKRLAELLEKEAEREEGQR